jgi:hypothetical protein
MNRNAETDFAEGPSPFKAPDGRRQRRLPLLQGAAAVQQNVPKTESAIFTPDSSATSGNGSMFRWMHGATATSGKAFGQAPFTMQRLRRQALWGCAAGAALLIAVLSSRSDFGTQRAAMLLSSMNLSRLFARKPETRAAAPAFDAEAATRHLAQEVRDLTEDRDRIISRLDDLEHNIDDMTGSIASQLATTKAASEQALMATAGFIPPGVTTPTSVASLATLGTAPPAGWAAPTPTPTPPSTPAAGQSAASESAGSPAPPAYGAELGSAHSIKTLHARWAQIHAAHPQIFAGLTPVVVLKDRTRSDRIALRLVVGPLPNAERAAHLCASLAAFHLPCQPTMFDGRHLTLE